MTTIAYRDGVLAADSLVASGETRVGSARKIHRLGPFLYGGSGSAGLVDAFEGWLRAGMPDYRRPGLKEGESTGDVYLFMPDGRCVWFHCEGATALAAPFHAFGSGGDIARGAMAAGASAAQAVDAAILLDRGSGGDVTVLTHA